MAAARNVSVGWGWPGNDGGHGNRALSVPIREDSPAARMTPAKLGDRDMKRKIAERGGKVSDGN
jgi:hypothetical protein